MQIGDLRARQYHPDDLRTFDLILAMDANNLRDIPTDTVAGKRTLAVRLGDRRTRLLYAVLLGIPFVALAGMAWVSTPWALLGLAAVVPAWGLVRIVRSGSSGPGLIPVLAGTGVTEIGYAALVTLGVAVAALQR